MRYIGLLDCNNFFVSCERLFRPDLRTRPTVVLSSNDGCVVARSQEIKDMGIPMGVPYFQVKDTLKDSNTAVFSSNFTHYRDISHRVFAVMKSLLDRVEQYSIDEAFCVLEGENEADIVAMAHELRDTVWQQVGIPVSVGIAASKTRAKYANSRAKKESGVCLMNETGWDRVASDITLGELWGVGAGRLRQFTEAGLVTVADYLAADPGRIERLFGIEGKRLWQELSGSPVYPVEKRIATQKSLMSTRSFKEATSEMAVLEDAVAYHVRQALEELREMGCRAGVLRVLIRPSRHGDYLLRGGSAEVVLTSPSDDTFVFLDEAMKLLRGLYERGVPYKKAGIMLGGIVENEVTQESLFAAETTERSGLMAVIDHLNHKLGRETVRLGDRRQAGKWQSRKDRVSPAYTTRWSDIATVQAK